MKPLTPHATVCIYKWENRQKSGLELPIAVLDPSDVLKAITNSPATAAKLDILAGKREPAFRPVDAAAELREEAESERESDGKDSSQGEEPKPIVITAPTFVLPDIRLPKIIFQGFRAKTQADYTIPPTPENKEESAVAPGELTPLAKGEVPEEDALSSRRWTFATEIPATKTANRVVGEILPEAARLFVRRNKDYGDGANELGLMGQYADINRKVKKLKRILWDGVEPMGESAEEIALDLIGHLGLTIDMLRKEEQKRAARQHLKAPITGEDF